MRIALVIGLLAASLACGGSPTAPAPASVIVQLEYVSPIITGTPSPEAGMCMHHLAPGGLVVAHPAWTSDETRLDAVEALDRTWRGTLTVRAGVDLTLGVRDAFLCALDPQPSSGVWAVSGLSVNGRTVTRRGSVSIGTIQEPGFVFRVDASGRVQ